jgi:hypothetical protein
MEAKAWSVEREASQLIRQISSDKPTASWSITHRNGGGGTINCCTAGPLGGRVLRPGTSEGVLEMQRMSRALLEEMRVDAGARRIERNARLGGSYPRPRQAQSADLVLTRV